MTATINDSTKLLASLWGETLSQAIKSARVLLVGAGGIGCEVIKNLLLSGFRNVEMIDLDTIDVSNLNRQFLFNKTHVGKPKSEVAAAVALDLFGHRFLGEENEIKLNALQGAIQSPEYNVDWYKSFTLVINALDNVAARSHVNRMCLAANVPLIESGSRGYFAQMYVIQKGLSQCYDCSGPRTEEKSFASCTIRNTPSLPIHCIVWAKHLFAQLFGEEDPDHDVSPDMNDPSLATPAIADAPKQNGAESGQEKLSETPHEEKSSAKSLSTRDWARSVNYDAKTLFDKFFTADIHYLLKMDKLWESRTRPVPLGLEALIGGDHDICSTASETDVNTNGKGSDASRVELNGLKDQSIWSLTVCYEKFVASLSGLINKLSKCGSDFLVWDKDDEDALDFVTAVSNLRSQCFAIPHKSRFEVKSLAGNIMPAISSTNSIVGGLVGLQAINILKMNLELAHKLNDLDEAALIDKRKAIFHKYARQSAMRSVKLPTPIMSVENFAPGEACIVCSTNTPLVEVSLSLSDVTMADLVEEVLIKRLNFVSPDVQLESEPTILWSKDDMEEEEDQDFVRSQKAKKLNEFHLVVDGVRLKVDDLLQNQSVTLVLLNDNKLIAVENEGLFYKVNIASGSLVAQEEKTEMKPGDDKEMAAETTKELVDPDEEHHIQEVTIEDDSQDTDSQEPQYIGSVDAATLKRRPDADGDKDGDSSKKRRLGNQADCSDNDVVTLD